MVVFAEVHLEAGAAELHVGVPHPPGEPAVSQGPRGAGFLVVGPLLASEASVGLLVDGRELVQAVHEIFLEHLEQQGQPDFPTGEAGQAGAGLYEGEVREPRLADVQAGAADVAGGLAQGKEEPVFSRRIGMGGEGAVGGTGDLPGARGHAQEVPGVGV